MYVNIHWECWWPCQYIHVPSYYQELIQGRVRRQPLADMKAIGGLPKVPVYC